MPSCSSPDVAETNAFVVLSPSTVRKSDVALSTKKKITIISKSNTSSSKGKRLDAERSSSKESRNEPRTAVGKDGKKKKKRKVKTVVEPSSVAAVSDKPSLPSSATSGKSARSSSRKEADSDGTTKRPRSSQRLMKRSSSTVEEKAGGSSSTLAGCRVRAGERIRFVRTAPESGSDKPLSSRSAASSSSTNASTGDENPTSIRSITVSGNSSSSSLRRQRQRVVPPCQSKKKGGSKESDQDSHSNGDTSSDDEPILLIRRGRGSDAPEEEYIRPHRIDQNGSHYASQSQSPSTTSKSKGVKTKTTKKVKIKKRSSPSSATPSPKPEVPSEAIAPPVLPPRSASPMLVTDPSHNESHTSSIMILDSDDDDDNNPIVYEDRSNNIAESGLCEDEDDEESTTWASLRNHVEMEREEEGAAPPSTIRDDKASAAIMKEDAADGDAGHDHGSWESDSDEESSDGWETDNGDDSSIEIDDSSEWTGRDNNKVLSQESWGRAGGNGSSLLMMYQDSAMTASTVSMTSRAMGESSNLQFNSYSHLNASLSRGPAALMEEEQVTSESSSSVERDDIKSRPLTLHEQVEEETHLEVNTLGIMARNMTIIEQSSVLTSLSPPSSQSSSTRPKCEDSVGTTTRMSEEGRNDLQETNTRIRSPSPAVGSVVDFTSIQVYEAIRHAPRLPIWWMDSVLHRTLPDWEAKEIVQNRMARRSAEEEARMKKTVIARKKSTQPPTGHLKTRLQQLSQVKRDLAAYSDETTEIDSYHNVKLSLLVKMKLLSTSLDEAAAEVSEGKNPVLGQHRDDDGETNQLLSDSWHSISSAPASFEWGEISPSTHDWNRRPSYNVRGRRRDEESATSRTFHSGQLSFFHHRSCHSVSAGFLEKSDHFENDFADDDDDDGGDDDERMIIDASLQEGEEEQMQGSSTVNCLALQCDTTMPSHEPPSLKKKPSIAALRQRGFMGTSRMHSLIGKFSRQGSDDEGEWIHPLYREEIANQKTRRKKHPGRDSNSTRSQSIDALVKLFEPETSLLMEKEDEYEEEWVHPLYRSMMF
jgi:hypothetical protein